MKKILSATCAMMLASAGMMANAQQLPNVGFEDWTLDNESGSSLNTNDGKMYARPGIEPLNWSGGNVNQFGLATSSELCTRGSDEADQYLVLTNKRVESFGFGATAPGFVTLSTPWIFATTSMLSESAIKLGDGGTYGGVAFEYKPDAISLKYRKTAVKSEVSRVIAYIWNGEFVSNVPKNIKNAFFNPSYSEWTTLTDVDRAIIGRESSGKVVKKGTLIAKVDYEITEDKSDWTSLEVPFTYEENTSTIKPEKMNVIISSGDYWNRSGLYENSTLDVDDVRFVYYSRLKSLKLNGVEIEGFSPDVYEYTVEGTKEVAFESELMSQFTTAKTEVHYNDNDNEYPDYATILVGRFSEDGELLSGEYKDVDDATSHEYRINFSYSSQLKSLKVNDVAVNGFSSDVYSYYVAGKVPAIEKVEAVAVDPEATIEMTRDEETATITIVVTNPKGVDEDGESSHTYVLNFQKFYNPVGLKYDGTLTIQLEGGDPTEMPEQSVYIDVKEDGTCTFGLYQFALAPGMVLGDIVVENVTMGTDENGNTTYNGEKKDIVLFLNGSPIFADATVSGTEDAAGNLTMTIPVIWKTGIGDAAPMMTINVTFDGQKEGTSGVESVAGDGVKVYAAAGCVVVEGAEGVAQVYTADGKQVAAEAVNGKTEIALANGLYIVRVGNKVQKVVVK